MSALPDLSLPALRRAYRSGDLQPAALLARLRAAALAAPADAVWIHLLDEAEVAPWLARLEGIDPESLPLYGVPFAIKDNIDLAGIPTTAACREFAYVPERSAHVVQRLLDAGALPLGKTNLDQFATGLVGTRSPYGATRNAFDPAYIAGGSSAGSAVAVAQGLVSFALGTDTAGSGRVPAAFNNLVGVKPTRGLLSTTGVLPACRTLDCVTVFALDVPDANAVMAVAQDFDPEDPYARPAVAGPTARARFRFGVPDRLEFFGDPDAQSLFEASVRQLEALGGEPVVLDFAPFREAAALLYEGPWVAERYAAIEDFVRTRPEALHPVTRAIIEPAREASAVAAFQAQYRLAALRRRAEQALDGLDVVLTPTAGTLYRIDEVEADPIRLNSNLGHYTNFMNLLDLAAVAVPAGFGASGLPFGVTLFGPAFSDRALADYAERLHRSLGLPRGATGRLAVAAEGGSGVEGGAGNVGDAGAEGDTGNVGDVRSPPGSPPASAPPASVPAASASAAAPEGELPLVVCGAHLSGLALNHQLTGRGARLLRATRTAPCYRLYALPGGPPDRPGLIRQGEGGAAIEVEVWALPNTQVGGFLAGIPAPLGLGRVELEDGSVETGFICEGYAVAGARDITALGGWRAFVSSPGDSAG